MFAVTTRVRRWSLALAVITVQVVAFAAAFALEQPTAYAAFAVLSAAILALGSGRGVFETLLAVFGTVLLLALGLPILMIVARQDPGLVLQKAASEDVQRALYLSVYGPLLSALLVTALGVPVAYLLSRGFTGQQFVESLIDLPLVVPHSVAGLAVLFAFGKGAAVPWMPVLGTLWGMVVAMSFVSAPFAVNAAREGFESIDRRVEQAARSLGASQFETFRRVHLPLAFRGVFTGGLLAWARSVSEFGAVAIVAYNVRNVSLPGLGEAAYTQTAPVLIFNVFTSQSLADSGAVAVLLLALCTLIFLVVRWVVYDSDGTHGGIA